MDEPERPLLSAVQSWQLQALLVEKARRKIEALRLYEPLPIQQQFHASRAPERIVRGSNRSGKTLCAAVEVARAVTNQDPYHKYPERGRAILVGKDGKHLGQIFFDKLFRAGSFNGFRIIRDRFTGEWRAYRPWDDYDRCRRHETKPMPPLIPPRLVLWKEISWENKRESIPSRIPLATGWEMLFFSSLGKPPQGLEADLVWMDEEIVDQQWYPELSTRLVDRGGRFIWSATPQAGTEQLYNLHERAEEEAYHRREPRSIEEFILLLSHNPHVGDEEKRALAAKLNEDERLVRIQGEFALVSFRVFPEYSQATHGVNWFQIPAHWTRYASIDPGRQVCAVLFAAVPPPDEGDFIYLYDEIYLHNADAEQFAQAMADHIKDQVIQAFIIDHRAGRQTEMASGRTIEDQYSDALRRHRVRSRATGYGFAWGSDNVQAGIEAARAWLRVRPDGTAKLRVLVGAVPNFDFEIRRYRYKRINGMPTDEPEGRGAVHQMANLRYLASYQPRWVKTKAPAVSGGALEAFRQQQQRRKRMYGIQGSYVRLGPGRPRWDQHPIPF